MVEQKTPLLELRAIAFGYQKQPLLYDVSLSVLQGELVALLGPNGSGKTTLQRLFSGLLQPRQGEVLLAGRPLRQWGRRGLAQRIAVVPQELHMPFAFSVEHMVSLGRTPFLSFLGTQTKRDAEIVQDAMAATGIVPLAERIFNELSGGERQRVMIAMALAQQPSVLLLDEPTSHLDIKYQIETLELVQKLNRERGMTVVAAIHDLNLAARYFPRLILFQRGIVADGGPAEVLEAGLLSRVYGIHVQVGILRGAEHLSIVPPSREKEISVEDETAVLPKVMLMAGGGSGERMMRTLADAQIPFSAGALNIGDSDHTLALRLATTVITEQPYAPLSQEVLAQVRVQLARSALLIICPMPLGPGNYELLREALDAARQGLSVVLLTANEEPSVCEAATVGQLSTPLEQSGILSRDYTGGEGTRLVEELLQAGAQVVSSVGEVLAIVAILVQSRAVSR